MDPEELFEEKLSLLSSADRYRTRVRDYREWCLQEEEVLDPKNAISCYKYLKFLHDQEVAATSLWAINSCIAAWYECYHNKKPIDDFSLIKKQLKKWQSNEEVKKSKTFTREQIYQFLHDAPEAQYFSTKVAVILELSGAMRTEEITYLVTDNDAIKINSDCILVDFYRCKSQTSQKAKQTICITDPTSLEIVRRYWTLLTPEMKTSGRFFRKLSSDGTKTTMQVLGKTFFQQLPKRIATYLNLKESDKYTGHCMRRTAATLLAESGGSLLALKLLGNWKSDSVAQSYVCNSERMKRTISNMLTENPSNHEENLPKTVKSPKADDSEDSKRRCEQVTNNSCTIVHYNITGSSSSYFNCPLVSSSSNSDLVPDKMRKEPLILRLKKF